MPDATSNLAKRPHGWPVSFSLMFEAGGQPVSGAGGVIPESDRATACPTLPTNAFFAYGVYARASRGCLTCSTSTVSKMSSFMIGRARSTKRRTWHARSSGRGHEAAAHGRTMGEQLCTRPGGRAPPCHLGLRGNIIRQGHRPTADWLECVLDAAIRRGPTSTSCKASASSTTSTSRAATSLSSSR